MRDNRGGRGLEMTRQEGEEWKGEGDRVKMRRMGKKKREMDVRK